MSAYIQISGCSSTPPQAGAYTAAQRRLDGPPGSKSTSRGRGRRYASVINHSKAGFASIGFTDGSRTRLQPAGASGGCPDVYLTRASAASHAVGPTPRGCPVGKVGQVGDLSRLVHRDAGKPMISDVGICTGAKTQEVAGALESGSLFEQSGKYPVPKGLAPLEPVWRCWLLTSDTNRFPRGNLLVVSPGKLTGLAHKNNERPMGNHKKNDFDDVLENFWRRMGCLIVIFGLAAAILIWAVQRRTEALMSAFWDGFLTGLQAVPRRFFAPMVD